MTQEEAKAFLAELGELTRKHNVDIWASHEDGEMAVAVLEPQERQGGWVANYTGYERHPLTNLVYQYDAPPNGSLRDAS